MHTNKNTHAHKQENTHTHTITHPHTPQKDNKEGLTEIVTKITTSLRPGEAQSSRSEASGVKLSRSVTTQ